MYGESTLDISNWDYKAIKASHRINQINHKSSKTTPPYLIPFSSENLIIFNSEDSTITKLKTDKLAGTPIISTNGSYAFIAQKDGWIKKIDLSTKKTIAKIRVGIKVANAALSGDGRILLIGNQQPADLVFLNSDDLHVERIIPVENYKGLVSPVTTVRNTGSEHGFIVTAKDFIKLWKISYLNPPPIGFGDGWNHDYRCLKEHVDKPLFPVKRLKTKQKIENFYVDNKTTFLVGKSEDNRGLIMDLDLSRVIERPKYLAPFPNSLWEQQGANRLATLTENKKELLIYSNEENPRHWKIIKTIAIEQATAIGSCAKSDTIWVSEKNANIKVINKSSMEIGKSLSLGSANTLSSIACSNDGKYMFLEANNNIAVYDNLANQLVKARLISPIKQ